ncbi:MAG TPA: lysylphosphatidylglycerol synthase transmembrane domain-containing protein [Thermoanaerobaculia bacterium]|nr:lysylphosphatidylglycerol synthase transmembrane domain-containing protein [Thermoanaerobaculia bacterium]
MKRILRFALILALTVFFLALFLRNSDPRSVLQLIATTNFGWLILAIGANMTALLCRSLRWRMILDPASPPRLYDTYFASAAGYMISMLLPIRAADVVRPALLSRRTSVKFSTALGTILTERMIDLFSMLTCFLLFFATAGQQLVATLGRGKVVAIQTAAGIALAVVLSVALFVVAIYFFNPTARKLHEVIGRILPRVLRTGWMRFFDSFVTSLRIVHHPRALAKVVFFTASLWMCLGLQFYLVLLAFDRPLPFMASFFVTAMAIIGLVVPTPAGVGGYHKASQIALTSFYLFDVNTSVAVAFIFHLVGVCPVIFTGIFLVTHEGLSWKSISRLAERRETLPDDGSGIGETKEE